MKKFEDLDFNNHFSQLSPQGFFSHVSTTPLSNQHLIHFNNDAAALIGLDPDEKEREDFIDIISGKKVIDGFKQPLAMCYAGHQFGQLVPQLGDGRAILLGQIQHNTSSWDLHIKGAGPTPYSRGSDGRAVLRSTIREYLCSEAMHGLGIATSRSLCMIGSDEEVYREKIESGAMMVRTAPSHIRFGSFEYFYYNNKHDALKELADYLIRHHYPELQQANNPYLALLRQSIKSTALLIAQWQSVGFSHGVMNTDNMSIHGLTLDYGPFGFLDAYNPDYICNHSDYQGRYAFNKQPEIGLFNLSCLAQALLPLIDSDSQHAADLAKAELGHYQDIYYQHYHQLMNHKLGLEQLKPEDIELQEDLLDLMHQDQIDYTIFFRTLSNNNLKPRDLFIKKEKFDQWFNRYQQRVKDSEINIENQQQQMLSINPKFILRNHILETAIIMAEKNDFSEIERLFQLMKKPFDENVKFENYANLPPEWASEIEISCSS